MFSIRCLRQCYGLRTQKIHGSLGSRRDFTALCRGRTPLMGHQKYELRLTHGKGGEAEGGALSFILLRWSKTAWSNMFGKYLLITNVVGSGLLMVVGDVIAQEYEYRRGLRHQDRFDTDRMYRMFVAGALQGPLHHYVYNWMDKVMPARTFQNILKKILIDQLVMSPACILIFFYSICYLERQTLEATNQELISKFPYVYLLDWMTWPAAQYLNFRYLDTKYRVTFVNVCTAVYNVLMSYMKHDFGIHLPLEEETLEIPAIPEAQKSV
ncbi:mpv17-like protein 2 [Drosophila takahashii]|uniref:mpv17-like protein 2 n=1 Tax=Drosophila takahashii TaxID=29030 RepID=UPI001CF8D107|nr:mpv17-like protein 2 [Drosophila takahashii]